MKIAFIVDTFPKISEKFILDQITGLLDLGHDVQIFYYLKPKDKKIHGDYYEYNLKRKTHYAPYLRIPQNILFRRIQVGFLLLFNFFRAPRGFLKLLNIRKYGVKTVENLYIFIYFMNYDFDVIHAHFGPNGILGLKIKKVLEDVRCKRYPLITSFYDYGLGKYICLYGKNVYTELFEKGELFLPLCKYFSDILIDLGCPKEKIIVHPLGVNTKKLKCISQKEISSNKVRILTVARLVEKKGLFYALKAIREVIAVHSDVEYVIAGEGPLMKNLQDLAKRLSIDSYIKFVGGVNDEEVGKLLNEADIFILPSVIGCDGDKEGTPTVLLEAQSCGLPVVSTFHSGIPEIVVDGRTGFLVKEKDYRALAEKIKFLIGNKEMRATMGINGRKFICDKFDITALNKKLLNIYNNLI